MKKTDEKKHRCFDSNVGRPHRFAKCILIDVLDANLRPRFVNRRCMLADEIGFVMDDGVIITKKKKKI